MFASFRLPVSGEVPPYERSTDNAPPFPGLPRVHVVSPAYNSGFPQQRNLRSPLATRRARDPHFYTGDLQHQTHRQTGLLRDLSPELWPTAQRRGGFDYREPIEGRASPIHDKGPDWNPGWAPRLVTAPFQAPIYRSAGSERVLYALNPEPIHDHVQGSTTDSRLPHAFAFHVPEEEYFENPRAVPAPAPHAIPFGNRRMPQTRDAGQEDDQLLYDLYRMGFSTPKAAPETSQQHEPSPEHVHAIRKGVEELTRSVKTGLTALGVNQIAGAAPSERLAIGVERIATVMETLRTHIPPTEQVDSTATRLEGRIEELEARLLNLGRNFRLGKSSRTRRSQSAFSDSSHDQDGSYESSDTSTDESSGQESDGHGEGSTASETETLPVTKKHRVARKNADHQPRVETDAEDTCEISLALEQPDPEMGSISSGHLKELYRNYQKSVSAKGKERAEGEVDACF